MENSVLQKVKSGIASLTEDGSLGTAGDARASGNVPRDAEDVPKFEKTGQDTIWDGA
jgi:hypothetical protein